MQTTRESFGEQVYRLFGDEINHYRRMFEAAESEWKKHVERCAYFDADFIFVSGLSQQDRAVYWQDKIKYFESSQFQPNGYVAIEVSWWEATYWMSRPLEYETLETELIEALRNYVLPPETTEATKKYVLRQMNPLSTSGQWI